ncbi:uncharacterized protein [Linepithema humile]|uniref:uncharacterized protein n=1 Tax=Linepithema humile TaxID=83485 RepID=UPI00351E74E6
MEEKRLETADGLRIPEAGVSGGIVPAPSTSSSYEGPTVACTAGATAEDTTAKKERMARILDIARHATYEVALSPPDLWGKKNLRELIWSLARVLAFLAYHAGDEVRLEKDAKTLLHRDGKWDEDSPFGGSLVEVREGILDAFYFIAEWRGNEKMKGVVAKMAAEYAQPNIQLEAIPLVFAGELFLSVVELLEEEHVPEDEDRKAHIWLNEAGCPWVPGTTDIWRNKEDQSLPPATGLKGGGKPVTRTDRKGMAKSKEKAGIRKRIRPFTQATSSSEEEELEEGGRGIASPPPSPEPTTMEEEEIDVTTPIPLEDVAPQPGPSTRVEGLPPPAVDFEDCLLSSEEEETALGGAPSSNVSGASKKIPKGKGANWSERFSWAYRAQGRPCADGSGPFISHDEIRMEQDRDVCSNSEEEGREEEIVPPAFTGPQKRVAVGKIEKMERGSTEELYKKFDRELLTIERIRQCSKNIRGQQSGRLKMGVFVMRQALKTLAGRAINTGDPGMWKTKCINAEREIIDLKVELNKLKRTLKQRNSEIADIRAGERARPLGERELVPPTRGGSPLPPDIVVEEGTNPQGFDMEVERPDSPALPPVSVEMSLKGIHEALMGLNQRMEALEIQAEKTRINQSAPFAIPAAGSRVTKGTRKRKGTKKVASKKAPLVKAPPSKRTGKPLRGEVGGMSPPPSTPTRAQQTSTDTGPGEPAREPVSSGPQNPPTGPTWAEVTASQSVGNRTRASQPAITPPSQRKEEDKKKERAATIRRAKRRMPRCAAIHISVKEPGSYSEVLKEARKEISLDELDITEIRQKRAFTGGLLLELPGGKREESEARASRLATVMQGVFEGNENVRITRPSHRLGLRLTGSAVSVMPEEIRDAIAKVGGCSPTEINVGPWRPPPKRGTMNIWVQGPDKAAIKAAEVGKIKAGWASFKVELQASKPSRCYRCHARGHVRQYCPSAVDRTNCCLNCGSEGHKVAQCKAKAHCPICAPKGKKADHRAGTEECPLIPPRRKPPPPTRTEEEEDREAALRGGGDPRNGPPPPAEETASLAVIEESEPQRSAPGRDSAVEDRTPTTQMESEPAGPTPGFKRAREEDDEGVEEGSNPSTAPRLAKDGDSAKRKAIERPSVEGQPQ